MFKPEVISAHTNVHPAETRMVAVPRHDLGNSGTLSKLLIFANIMRSPHEFKQGYSNVCMLGLVTLLFYTRLTILGPQFLAGPPGAVRCSRISLIL